MKNGGICSIVQDNKHLKTNIPQQGTELTHYTVNLKSETLNFFRNNEILVHIYQY